MAPPPDGSALSLNHGVLKGSPSVQGTLAPMTNFVSASGLRPGMVIPVVESTSDWATSVWSGSYQVSSVEPLFLKRVFIGGAGKTALPPFISVDLAVMDGGLLASTEAAYQRWSPKMLSRLSTTMLFVPANAGRPASIHGGTGLHPLGFSGSSGSSDPPRITFNAESMESKRVTLQCMAVNRVLNNDKTRIQNFLGASMSIAGNHCRVLAGSVLSVALKKLAVYQVPKNFEKMLEFHYAAEEPPITALGVASWCHLGLCQVWDKPLTTVPIFTSCDQIAKALDLWAELLDKTFAVTMFASMVQPLASLLKSNDDRGLKSLPVDYTAHCVNTALANLGILFTAQSSISLSEDDFVELATEKLTLDSKKVAEDCVYAKLADPSLANYSQHGCGNPVLSTKRKLTDEDPVPPGKRLTSAEKKALKKQKRVAAGASASSASELVPTPTRKGKVGLCYTWAAHAFGLQDASPCTNAPCHNKHTPFVRGGVDKDAVKAELAGIKTPDFKAKLFAAIDAF